MVDPVLSTGVKLFHRNPQFQDRLTYVMDVPRGRYLVVAAVCDPMFGSEHDVYVVFERGVRDFHVMSLKLQ